ncbi:unannotated protein [freshwater metagenome]|uniref:Unannotated protein n=1 Tax=freshwater metagenome TaxID=449393 RepID=A0A6J6PR41_9ZZZZ
MMSARSAAGIPAQSPVVRAVLAATTARSMSPTDPSGVDPISSSVAGLMTWKRSVPAGLTHSPPM